MHTIMHQVLYLCSYNILLTPAKKASVSTNTFRTEVMKDIVQCIVKSCKIVISCDAANRSPDVGNCSLAHKNKKKLKLSLSKPKKTATGKERLRPFRFC